MPTSAHPIDQHSPRVAFQGAPGAFSEEAVQRVEPGAIGVPMRENRDVTRAVAAGAVDLGQLPIENTLAGSVFASYDAILDEPTVHAVAEFVLPIHHCVLGVRGSSLDALSIVESHPVALAQCSAFFAAHPSLESRAVWDTAGAAADLVQHADVTRGAIASRAAASRYGLEVLAENVEDRADNQTRFLLLSTAPAQLRAETPARTLLVATTNNEPGALLRLLEPLAARRINLVKLESRPTGEPWTYRFVLEFEHLAGDTNVDGAIAAIGSTARSYRIIGTYPSHGGIPVNGRVAPAP